MIRRRRFGGGLGRLGCSWRSTCGSLDTWSSSQVALGVSRATGSYYRPDSVRDTLASRSVMAPSYSPPAEGAWSSTFCCYGPGGCGCMAPMAPYPWFDTSPSPGPGTGSAKRTTLGHDPELYNEMPGCIESLGCNCCWTIAENAEAVGMLSDGTAPCGIKDKQTCC
eukprot:5960429-Prymnesium_polylepis.1